MDRNKAVATFQEMLKNENTGFVIVKKELHNLLNSVKTMHQITTFNEVLDVLRIYLSQKRLYDPKNPVNIYCKDDDLGSVFGTTEFTLHDIKAILPKLVFPCNKNGTNVESPNQSSVSEAVKRKSDSDIVADLKKSRQCSSDSAESVEECTVNEFCCYSDEDNSSIFAVEETYAFEYDVDSSSSECCLSAEETDSDSDLRNFGSAVIQFICKSDSDKEFWADKSSDEEYNSDVEIFELDKWQCSKCGSQNLPPNRFCMRCFYTRSEWLSENKNRQRPRRRKPRTKRSKKTLDLTSDKKEAASSSSQTSLPSSSQESVMDISSDISASTESKLCLLCCSNPINASIIHGKYAHSVCCYQCGRKLTRCPICRRTIDRMVYQL